MFLISSVFISVISFILFSGIAYFSSPTITSNACIIASVSGNLIINAEPLSFSVLTSTVPLSDSILVLTTSNPTPRPDILLI